MGNSALRFECAPCTRFNPDPSGYAHAPLGEFICECGRVNYFRLLTSPARTIHHCGACGASVDVEFYDPDEDAYLRERAFLDWWTQLGIPRCETEAREAYAVITLSREASNRIFPVGLEVSA